ncbi:hypothetical protein ACUV8E_004756 [Escherichia coli]
MIDKIDVIFNVMDKWGIQGLVVGGLIALAFPWMKQKNMIVIFRWLSGIIKKSRLKSMLSEEHVSPETQARILLELRQQDNMWLTGMQAPGLADIVVELTVQNNLRARYFYIWRRWLTESEGVIIFDEKRYNIALKEHYVISSVGLLPALIMSFGIYQRFNILPANMIYVLAINIVAFIGLMIFVSWIPGQKLTEQMKYYIEKYNSKMLP